MADGLSVASRGGAGHLSNTSLCPVHLLRAAAAYFWIGTPMSDPTGDSLDEKVGAALMTTHAGPHDYIAEVIALVRSEVEPEIREKVAQEIEPRPEITTLGGGSYGAGCIYGLRLAAAIIRGSR